MTIAPAPGSPGVQAVGARPWIMLALGGLAQAAGTVLVSTPAFLIPLLHTQRGVPLATAGLLASAPTIGMVLTLVLWGALADRLGERWVIAGGTGLAAVFAGAAAAASGSTVSDGYVLLGVCLVLAGMASASANAASGRLVVGWFPRHRRGLAMGIRQMSQPLGVAFAALAVPALAESGGIPAALVLSVVVCGVLAIVCALFLRDPARAAQPSAGVETNGHPHRSGSSSGTGSAGQSTTNPYRQGGVLWRIHGVSLLLVIPQFTLTTFGLVWLITEQALAAPIAGLVIGASQVVGAIGRIAIGVLSDRVDSRMVPLRWVSLSAVAVMVALAALDWIGWPLAIAALVVAMTVSVADNGLAFTAVAEIAGPSWSGRALGIQNTGQFIAASAVGPLAGVLIGIAGYPVAFLAAAACALVAVPLVPRRDVEHRSPPPPAAQPIPTAAGAAASDE